MVALAHASAIAREPMWRVIYDAYLVGLALAALFVPIGATARTGRVALRRVD